MDGIRRSQQSGQAHKGESIASSKEASSAELGKQFKQASDGFQEIMPKLKTLNPNPTRQALHRLQE